MSIVRSALLPAMLTLALLVGGGTLWVSDVAFERDWRVARLDGASLPPGGAGVVFTGRRGQGHGQPFEVRTACDSYAGRYSRRFGRLEVRRLNRTERTCPADAALLATIQAARTYRYAGRDLVVEADGGRRLTLSP